MKKLFLVLIFLFVPLIHVNATGGACSSHDGVNCSTSDWDGSVVCNDGWTDSIVSYYDADECHLPPPVTCTTNEFESLMKINIYPLQNEINGLVVKYNNNLQLIQAEQNTNKKILIQIEASGQLNSLSYKAGELHDAIKSVKLSCELLGYEQLNKNKSSCSMSNSYLGGDNICYCNNGYIMNNGKCVTYAEGCQIKYGYYSYGNKNYCHCVNGYMFNTENTTCIVNPIYTTNIINYNQGVDDFVSNEKKLLKDIDKKISKRLKGKILLQVEDKGQAWYVNPKDEKKYYMANGDEAFNIMRNLGVGVTNKDLEKIKSDKKYAQKNSGKIFLQIEAHGEAYYIDFNGSAHYLKDGGVAYTTMRDLGLGVTNNDLRKIGIGE